MQVPTQFAHELRLPMGVELPQDEEWCELVIDGRPRRIRFHDYAQVYAIPGLYEYLFHHHLFCMSPQVVCSMLDRALCERRQTGLDGLRVLDVGAGNGMVGAELMERGAAEVVGVDVLPDAARAAKRDRPGVYRDYFVADLTNPPADTHRRLMSRRFDCATMVSALGFDGLSPQAFLATLSYVKTPGWVSFTVKEQFLNGNDEHALGSVIARSFSDDVLRPVAKQRYRHRNTVSGKPLYYIAYVAEKTTELAMATGQT